MWLHIGSCLCLSVSVVKVSHLQVHSALTCDTMCHCKKQPSSSSSSTCSFSFPRWHPSPPFNVCSSCWRLELRLLHLTTAVRLGFAGAISTMQILAASTSLTTPGPCCMRLPLLGAQTACVPSFCTPTYDSHVVQLLHWLSSQLQCPVVHYSHGACMQPYCFRASQPSGL